MRERRLPLLWESTPAYRFVSYGANQHRSTDVFEHLDMAIVERRLVTSGSTTR